MSNELLYVTHMLERIIMIENFSASGRDYFISDLKTQEAILRCFEILGEAATKLPESFRQKYSDIAWRQMIGMRNLLIHNYQGVNINLIWDTIITDLPPLHLAMDIILNELMSGSQHENDH